MEQVWRSIIRECPSLKSFNLFVLPLMKLQDKPLRDIAAEEAKRRGYVANKSLGVYE